LQLIWQIVALLLSESRDLIRVFKRKYNSIILFIALEASIQVKLCLKEIVERKQPEAIMQKCIFPHFLRNSEREGEIEQERERKRDRNMLTC
jgi:hypothetical protein